jgi:hypothetical protein
MRYAFCMGRLETVDSLCCDCVDGEDVGSRVAVAAEAYWRA